MQRLGQEGLTLGHALPPVFGIAGFKNAGKTTLLAALVRELTARGFRVGSIKHAHHAFDIDHPGKDSWRHREAGAREVVVVSGQRLAHLQELDGPPPSLDALLARFGAVDLVLAEGYKASPHRKLEVRRKDAPGPALGDAAAGVVAIAADFVPPGVTVPVLPLDDVPAIADFIVDTLGLPRSASSGEPVSTGARQPDRG
ncbi:MAG: molybdopterin-guanine dinucleotide biosynthesis protein B [Chromatiales bacterium]|nr:molybdopterin-guanine dinucleotide biosynthesis protein B [Chromatiales bacterium]